MVQNAVAQHFGVALTSIRQVANGPESRAQEEERGSILQGIFFDVTGRKTR
jgi:hypothetical protein